MELDHVSEELIANSKPNCVLYCVEILTVCAVFQDNYQRPHRDDWFTVGLFNRYTFLQVLANSALHFKGIRKLNGAPEPSKLATTYYQMAVRNMKERLTKVQQAGVLVQQPGAKQGSKAAREIDALIGTASAFICFAVRSTS